MDRVAIKSEAKELTKTNKWNVWKPMLLLGLISFVVGLLISLVGGEKSVAGGVVGTIYELAVLPVSVGIVAYYLNLVRGKEFSLNQLKEYYPFYLKILAISILTAIFVFLWSILFIIPGIIAAIGYTMVFFICVDNPDLTPGETLKKSKELMNGHKMDYFVFELSFLGWIILGAFTFGILYIWLIPYMTIAQTLFYDKLVKLQKGSK